MIRVPQMVLMTLTAVLLLSLPEGTSWAEVVVAGVVYDHVDAGEPFTPAEQPEENWPAAAGTRAEVSAGMTPYWRGAPEELRPWSRPKTEECLRSPLRMFATLGEIEPTWVALYAREALSRISARVDNLPPGVTAELFVVHFWPQRTSWKTRQYYITPELLLPYDAAEGYAWFPAQGVLERKPYDLAAGTTGAIWLRLTVARSTTPGRYRFTLNVKAENRDTLSLPIELEVLPFELRKPPSQKWLMYGDLSRWAHMTDEQRWLDAKDYAAHGMDGLVEMPLGKVDLSELGQGRVKWDVSDTRRYLELLRQAEMTGPWVMSGGVERQVRDVLGLDVDLNQPWPENLCRGVQLAAAAASDTYRGLGLEWYFYGVDEPGADNVFALEQYRNWKAGGAPVYVTMYKPDFWTAMAQYLDAPCFSSSMVNNPESCEKIRRECARLGKQFWWYGSGCYIGQEGRMFPNRFLAGYLFWKTGARCQVSWTYIRPHEDPFNDFDGEKANSFEPKDQATVYPWLEKAGDWSTYRGPLQTIQWEALREGVDDYCYLWTLADSAEDAASAPGNERSRAGRQAKRALRDISNALPWSSDLPGLGFDNARCHSLRRLVATHIQQLEEGTLGKLGARPAERPVDINLEMRPAGRATARTLPALCVPRLATAPTIDGALDDEVWAQAATVDLLRNTQTGEPVTPATRVQVGYDDSALYVAFRCEEPMMDSLVAERRGRDAHEIWLDDSVEVFVDPTGRRERYAHLIVNAAGELLDEIGENASWMSSAKVATRRDPGVWQCEIALPWSDLDAAGLPRGRVMALNLCRNRFADPKGPWRHAAWSATYGWYHMPERFGVGLIEEGDLGLVDLELPVLFGRQMMRVALLNRAGEAQLVRIQAAATYEGESEAVAPEALMVHIEPGQRAEVNLPVILTRSGKAHLTLSYGPPEGTVCQAEFDLVVPEPVSLPARMITVGRDNTLRAVLEMNMAPSGGDEIYVASATYYAAGLPQWRGTLRCAPGQRASLEGKARAPLALGWLELGLSCGGQKVWQTRVPVVPEFEAFERRGR